ncbi:endonuclease/exonuclease/phosphatase family protein [Mycolicibacterium wolinskyi]|uniref:Endonuclease n=2 Tax=Mycobacteriaceae TaxID=1762 RepID=A0A1X2F860_9MYCO|nr:endonuclease/exonuclease/phosphatase family protein [Mycolicibacterium wolinskyi]MCV7293674.1 endonuclease/exonuclease/phosphatase family protein [Mycolicibacterium goodii]ORX14605.1 endonuclease [Mycolicibacterium wolinskyi]
MSNIYAGMRRKFGEDEAGLRRCAERLLALREGLAPIREQRSDHSLLLATWNIRDFDGNKFGFGPRKLESLYYLAEVISSFDLVAVQEINRDLRPLQDIMKILGGGWDYIVTDATEGSSGNNERMAFLFDKDKVFFRKIAGEVVLPEGQTIVSRADAALKPGDAPAVERGRQFARSPFLVAFQSGWFKFSLCTVHIFYGSESGAALQRRIEEIKRLMAFFAKRQDKEVKDVKEATEEEGGRLGPTQVENYILLGDFNVVSPKHETMKALASKGFDVPDAIDGDAVRREDDHYYDQIAVRVKDKRFEVTGGGIIRPYEHVFRDEDIAVYETDWRAIKDKNPEPGDDQADDEAFYRKWRTWQISDHMPLWVKITTDFADDYLEKLAQ